MTGYVLNCFLLVVYRYLRMPYQPDPGKDSSAPEQLAFQANREVRHTVIRMITAHLGKDAEVPWQSLSFDFTGVVFDGDDFIFAKFSSGELVSEAPSSAVAR